MTPYYADDFVTLYHGDGREAASVPGVVMTDPPYNVGYHYASYDDRLPQAAYLALLAAACRTPSVVIQYPEPMFGIAAAIGEGPSKTVAWVYNANTPKQWRMVAWFGVTPDLSLVRQPYKNPTDRRVAALIAAGNEGPAVYDWWHIDQIKNVSDEKVGHPCQVPVELMARIIAVTPAEVIVDRAYMTLGVTDPTKVLHLCSGSMRIGVRVDIRPEMQPDIVADCRSVPLPDESFDWVMADPPYSEDYAENLYGTGADYPKPGQILKEAARLLRPGGRVGLLHFQVPMHRPPLRMVGVWGVSTGAGYAIRAWTVFEKAHGGLGL